MKIENLKDIGGKKFNRCNVGLGRFFDDDKLLSNAIEYLRGFQCHT